MLMKRFTSCRNISNCRSLLAVACLGASLTASAQEINILENLTDAEGTMYIPISQAISSNYKYVAGPAMNIMEGSYGMFVMDLESGNYVVEPAVDYYGADIRAVTDDGVAIGYNGPGLTFAIDGTTKELTTPNPGTTYGRDVTDDGKLIVGCYTDETGYNSHACIWKDGEYEPLPEPTDEEAGLEVNGTSAYYVSGDGSIIVGYVVDNFSTNPVVLWRLQDDGSYKLDLLYKDYFQSSPEDSEHQYWLFAPSGISRNGKYLALNVGRIDTEERMARYNLETGELEEFIADGNGDIPAGNTTTSSAIADDGTIVGWMLTGEWMMQVRSGAIWRNGETQVDLLANLYPEIPEIAGYDTVGFTTVCDITPNGKYLTGFAMNENYYYESFVINLSDDPTGINEVANATDDAAETARYTIDGKRITAPVKGLNIIKKADGSVVKVMVK